MPLQPNQPPPRPPASQAQARTVPVALGGRLSVANPIGQHIISPAPLVQVTRIASVTGGQPITTHVVGKQIIPKLTVGKSEQGIHTVSIGQSDTPVTSGHITHLLSSGSLVSPLGQHVNLSQAPQRVTIQAMGQHQQPSTTVSSQPVALTLSQTSTTQAGITHGTQHVGIMGNQMSLICPPGKTGPRLTSQPTQLLQAYPSAAPRAGVTAPKPITGNIVRATAASTQPQQAVLSHLSARGPVITPIRTIARPNSPAVPPSTGLSFTVPSSQVDGQKLRTLTAAEMSIQPRSAHDTSAAPRPVITHSGATKTIQLSHHPGTQKIVMTTTTVTAVGHPSITVAITKSVASQIVASTLLPSSVVSSTAALTQSIPIAKVTPQRQLISQMDSGSVTTSSSAPVTTLYLPPRPSSSTTQVTTTVTSSTTSEVKTDQRINPMIHYSFSGQYDQQYQNLGQVYSSLQTTHRPTLVQGHAASTASNSGANISVSGSLAGAVQGPARLNQVVVMDPNRHIQVRTAGSTQIQAVHLPVPAQPVTQAQSPSHVVTQSPGPAPTASPRPSILRKRTNDGYPVVGKKALPFSLESGSPRHDRASSPKPLESQQREASQSSTDTASSVDGSNNSTPTMTDMKVKLENAEGESLPSLILRDGTSSVEASPRKKPRKQLLQANEELKDEPPSSSSDEDDGSLIPETEMKEEEEDEDDMKEEIKEERIDEEGIRWVPFRKRNDYQLMNHYPCTWKTKNNHFLRYTDVRPKDERRPTVNELSNQKHIHQKTSGWKLYHLAAQLDDLVDLEGDVKQKMSNLQSELAPECNRAQYGSVMDDEMMIHELTQANIQRSQLIVDQIKEAKQSMLSLLEHKTKISEIVQKNRSKRPVKTKARM